jgi:hypothetical protein
VEKRDRDDEMDRQLLKQGFSFDVLWKEVGARCDLVEPNVFGARINLDLFHWVRDLDVLYWNEREDEIARWGMGLSFLQPLFSLLLVFLIGRCDIRTSTL